MEDQISLLERAAGALMSSGAVTHNDRVAAEEAIMSFRQSKHPYDACRHILVNCRTPYVQFVAASTICEALVREWASLSQELVDSLQTFVLSLVAQNPSLDAYIREKLLVSSVVILKRSLLDRNTAKASQVALFSKIHALLAGECTQVSIACAVLRAMIRECSLFSSSSDAGLTWASHGTCKAIFQCHCLPEVFQLVVNMLKQYSTVSSLHTLDPQTVAVLPGFLEVAELALSWDFTTSRSQKNNVSQLHVSAFRPGKKWIPLVLKSDFLSVLFKLHDLCKGSQQLHHLTLRCLVQMASLSGPVMQELKDKLAYVIDFLQLFLPLLQSGGICQDGSTALAFATIIAQMTNAHSHAIWTSLDESVMQTFTVLVSTFACSAAQGAHSAEQSGDSEAAALFQESFDKLLECWLTWLTTPSKLLDYLLPQTVAIFEAYLSWRLSGTSPSYQDQDEVDELDEDDRVQYEDQLCSMGSLSRAILPNSLPVLCRLMEERLSQWLETCRQCANNATLATSEPVSRTLAGLYEDLHWLVLLAGHTLCYDCLSGETPTVPKPVRDFSAAHQSQVSAEVSRSYVSVLKQPIMEPLHCPDGVDFTVRLMVDVMRVADFQHHLNVASRNGLTHLSSSPQLSRSLFFYLRCWCATYVMFDSRTNESGSSLSGALSMQGDGETYLQWIVDQLTSELPVWTADADVLQDLADLLGSLTECPIRFHLALNTQAFWDLTVSCIRVDSWLRLASSQSCISLLSALVRGCSSPPSTWSSSSSMARFAKAFTAQQLTDIELQGSNFLAQVLAPLRERFVALCIGTDEFSKRCQEAPVTEEVLSLLSLLRGVILGVSTSTKDIIFSLVAHVCLPSKPDGEVSGEELQAIAGGASFGDEHASLLALIKHFNGRPDVMVAVLELFHALGSSLLPIISQDKAHASYAILLRCIQLYAACNRSKFSTVSRDDGDDQIEDLVVFLKLFDLITSRDYWFESQSEDETSQVAGIDVVFCGLSILLPLISRELLQFPKLCEEFFRVISFISEFHSSKVVELPDDLFSAMMQSLELGLSNFGTEVMRLCLQAVSAVAEWFSMKGDRNPGVSARLSPILEHFLELVFNKVLLNPVDGMNELSSSAEALFQLICSCQGTYQQCVEHLLSSQPDVQSRRRLSKAFDELTPPDLLLVPEHSNKAAFRRNLQMVLETVRDLLLA